MNRAEWELSDIHIREVLAIELRHRDLALEKQASEYERRLEILNGEAVRIASAAALSVSVDKFEGYIAQTNEWKEGFDRFRTGVEKASEILAKEQARLRALVLAWIAIATLVLAVVSVLLRDTTP
jgi:hypothetical protein